MGACSLHYPERTGQGKRYTGNKIEKIQKILAYETRIPIEVAVEHFTPSSFPLNPKINSKCNRLCNASWESIVRSPYTDSNGYTTSGMTMFYTEFYSRLAIFDSSGKFEAVLSSGSSEANNISSKGAILTRIIKFVLRIEEENEQTQLLLYMLGRSHAQKAIRPWQYSVFVQTLLITISSRLGSRATTDVMAAWVHLFAFVMKSMLPPAIQDQIVETEFFISTSSEFSGGKVAEEVKVLEESKRLRNTIRGIPPKGSISQSSSELFQMSPKSPLMTPNSGRSMKAPSIKASPGSPPIPSKSMSSPDASPFILSARQIPRNDRQPSIDENMETLSVTSVAHSDSPSFSKSKEQLLEAEGKIGLTAEPAINEEKSTEDCIRKDQTILLNDQSNIK